MQIVMTLGLLAGAVPAMADQVYRWVDENGVVNFSDTAPEPYDTSTLMRPPGQAPSAQGG